MYHKQTIANFENVLAFKNIQIYVIYPINFFVKYATLY